MSKIPDIDKGTCLGCGTCVAVASKSFRIGSDNKAEVILPPEDDEALIQEAIDSCPVAAISYAVQEQV